MMKDYNELVKNVITKRQNEYHEVEKSAEIIIEKIIKKFEKSSIDYVTLKIDEKAGVILLCGEEILKNDSSKVALVYEEVSKMLDGDIQEMEAFKENFYTLRKEGKIKISIRWGTYKKADNGLGNGVGWIPAPFFVLNKDGVFTR